MARSYKRAIIFLFILISAAPTYPQGNLVLENNEMFLKYGISAGITSSGFSSDSIGYAKSNLPFGGIFLKYDIFNNLYINYSMLFMTIGAMQNTPYIRYRHNYLSNELVLGYKLFVFLNIEGGYRYGFATNSKKILLAGNQSSGTERKGIESKGNYGQFVVGGVVDLGQGLNAFVRYGIQTKEIALSHFQVGLSFRLNDLGDKSQSRVVTKQQAKLAAQGEAFRLKNGVLLVRLPTMRTVTDTLEKLGEHQKVARIEKLISEETDKVITAFNEYNFSEVLFFYDYNSLKVKQGEYSSVVLNKMLQPATIPESAEFIFIAEFGDKVPSAQTPYMQRDARYLIENKISRDSSAAWIYSSDQGLGVGGLNLMDHNFSTLNPPFPSFIPITNKTLFKELVTYEKAVRKLNEQLNRLIY